MRLQIGIQDNYLHLDINTQVQLDMNSTLFFGDRNQDLFEGILNYTFSIPDTPYNSKLTGRPSDLSNPDEFKEEDGWYIKFDGWVILEGRIEVQTAQYEGRISLLFIGGLAGNLTSLKETYLHQIEYDTVTLGADDTEVLQAANTIAGDPDSSPFIFPTIRVHKDGSPDDDDNHTEYQYLNLYQNGSYVKSGLFYGDTVYSTLAPQLRLKYVLEKVLATEGYTLAGVFDTHELSEELSNLILFNITTLDNLISEPSDPVTFADLYLSTSIDLNDYVPRVTCSALIRAVCNVFCLAPILDIPAKQLILVDHNSIIANKSKSNWTDKVNPNYLNSKQDEDIPLEFRYNHTDEDYADLNAKKDPGNLDYTIYENYSDAKAAILLDDHYVFRYIYIRSLNEFFEANNYPRGNNTFVRLVRKGKDLGIVNEYALPSYSPNADTLHMTHSYEYASDPVLFRSNRVNEYLPVFFDNIVTPLQSGDHFNSILFLIYRGLHPDQNAADYPLATSGRYRWDESSIGDLSLLWRGDNELFSTWWSKWMTMLEYMRPVSYATRLTAKDLATLDWTRSIKIDQHEYYVKRIQVTLTINQILPATIKYLKKQ